MLAAVALSCGCHQCSRVCPTTVKCHSTGTVIGRTGSYMAMLSRHLNHIRGSAVALIPGEVPFVCSAVDTSSKVGRLARD